VSLLEIPSEWTQFQLGQITNLPGGKTPSKANVKFWDKGTIPWVSPKDMKVHLLNDSQDKVAAFALEQGGLHLYPENSILIVVRSGILQHTLPIAIAKVAVSVNQDLKVIPPIGLVDQNFLAYLLRSFSQKILEDCSKTGTTVNSVEVELLAKLKLPFPSLPEQKQIAAKLDELLVQVDTIKTRLDAIPHILKRFRQSVLAAAVSGKLTEDWRAGIGLGSIGKELFAHSQNLTLSEIGLVSGGLTKNAKREQANIKKPFLRVANVYTNELRLDDVHEIGLTEKEFKKTKLESGDLLIVEGNGSLDQIGRVAMWKGQIENCVHQNHLIRWRSNDNVEPRYVLYFLMSPDGRRQIVDVAQSTTGLHTLSVSKISALNLIVPTIAEQTEIVHRVEQLFAYADQIEQRVKDAQTRVNHLTQSILAKAFRGELTADWRAQNPDQISGDNSASALLARIRAEREAAGNQPKTRKRKERA